MCGLQKSHRKGFAAAGQRTPLRLLLSHSMFRDRCRCWITANGMLINIVFAVVYLPRGVKMSGRKSLYFVCGSGSRPRLNLS